MDLLGFRVRVIIRCRTFLLCKRSISVLKTKNKILLYFVPAQLSLNQCAKDKQSWLAERAKLMGEINIKDLSLTESEAQRSLERSNWSQERERLMRSLSLARARALSLSLSLFLLSLSLSLLSLSRALSRARSLSRALSMSLALALSLLLSLSLALSLSPATLIKHRQKY